MIDTICAIVMGGCVIALGIGFLFLVGSAIIDTISPTKPPIDVAAERKKIIAWQLEDLEDWERRFCAATSQRYLTPKQRQQAHMYALQSYMLGRRNDAQVAAYEAEFRRRRIA